MAEDKLKNEEEITPNQNPKKSKNNLPILTNCYSCNFHSPISPQTLTRLRTLDSEWRIVLLCDTCFNLIKSASKCAYCFENFEKGEKDRIVLDCVQCKHRIHVNCMRKEQRFVNFGLLKKESFVCVDCCAIPRVGGGKCEKRQFCRVNLDEFVENAKKKDDCSVNDEDLALKLHLAMNGSQRISRSSANSIGKLKRIEFCRGNTNNINGCSSSSSSSSSIVETFINDEEKVMNCIKTNKLDGWITYQRASKLKGIGSWEKISESEQLLNGENGRDMGEKSGCDVHDRFAKKYCKRKLRLNECGDDR